MNTETTEATLERTEDEGEPLRALCADLTVQLEGQGWKDVNIRPLRRFIQVSATDPSGRSHGGARTDGRSLVDYLISLGATIQEPPKVDVREAVAKLAVQYNPAPEVFDLEADEFRYPERHTYEEPEPPAPPKAEESVPLPLAALVPPNLDLIAQKAWAQQRWLDLNARLLDEAKPDDKRAFNPMTTAEKAELGLLQRWIGWFS